MIKIIFCGYKDKDGRQYPPDMLPESVRKTIVTAIIKERSTGASSESFFPGRFWVDFDTHKDNN